MSILRNDNVACLCRIFSSMLNLRNEYVTCHYIFSLHVAWSRAIIVELILHNGGIGGVGKGSDAIYQI